MEKISYLIFLLINFSDNKISFYYFFTRFMNFLIYKSNNFYLFIFKDIEFLLLIILLFNV